MKLFPVIAALAAATASCATAPAAGDVTETEGRAELGWLLRQGIGQAEVLLAARPISRVLADDETPDIVKRRLAVVVAARRFAADELGLSVGAQYRTVTFLDGPAVVYVVSAAPRTSLTPYQWTYPIMGALPYRGYFSLEEAEDEAQRIAERGLDVDVRPVATYSLLGLLPDPVVSPMLFTGDEVSLVETVIHELAHATVFARGQGAFNEGLATFIGRQGRRRFVDQRFGPGSAVAQRMEARDKDIEAYAQEVSALAFDLRVLFAQARALGEAELLARKDRIFLVHQTHFREEVAPSMATYGLRRARLPDNNAELSAYGIYSLKQRIYEEAYRGCNEDMRCLIRALKDVASAEDPELALAERVHANPTAPRIIR